MKKVFLLLLCAISAIMVHAAWSFSGGTMYFDNSQTKWDKASMMFIIGHNNWSAVYEMAKGENDIWSVTMPTGWNDASYMAVINGDSKWGDGTWGPSNITNASYYSAAYTTQFNSDGSKCYMLTPQSNNKGCSLTLAETTCISGGGGTDDWLLQGDFVDASWSSPAKLDAKTGGEANTLYATKTLVAGKSYEFKINKGSAWYGNSGIMTQAHHDKWLFSTSESSNCRIMTTIAGNYEFAFNTETKEVSVSYPYNPKQATLYESAVRENNPDVMIQAFYWAHEGTSSTPYTEFGNVNWSNLGAEAEMLAQYFDLVWLAPSQETADYTGYLPMNYSNQGIAKDVSGHHGHSPWGTAQELRTLIDKLHHGGAKVIADIVLNHTSAGHVDEYTGSDKNWCSWTLNDFGRYGKFTPDWSWITAEDEMFADDVVPNRIDKSVTGDCGNHTGMTPDESGYSYKDSYQYWSYSEYNSTYSRDLAHQKKEVQELSRAYLTWMRDSIGYDGFRWDFMKGFHGSHLFDYNRAAAPYFSVAEVFDGDIDKQLGFLKDANYSTYVFDFPGKFTIYNEAIRPYALKNLKGNKYTMIFGDNKKYAVSFIDNHDSFHEKDKSMHGEANKIDERQARQALAYMLSMPGVPCVLYPYWNNHKDECKAFIMARKAAGVHSMSEVVNDWAGSGDYGDNYYTALVKGTKGYIFLKLGYDAVPNAAPSVASPDGKTWKCAWANRDHAGVWYTGDDWTPYIPTAVETIEPAVNATKFIKDGVMYIQRGNEIYNAQGLRIQ